VIEANRSRAEVAADALERTIVLHGDGLDMELLREAGVERTDAVLCVTDDDKTNLLASVRAKSAGAHGHRAGERPDAGAADGAAVDRRLYQPARHHRQFDPAPYPARPGARRSIPSAMPRPR
jgi:hypothetical protein